MADVLTEIFRAANKHPNSRVSKLIHQVEAEPTQKNIVLLLIELAEHAEYSTDFNVSLKYYLDLFERCGIHHDLVLNEAGLLLVNSSKIYSKRVDFIQSLVERQILTLSNTDDELQKQRLEQEQTENATTPVEKPKRGRKRALEAPSDPYEVELTPKKFKKMTEEKRFALPKLATKIKTISRNIEMEQHIHPAGWQHATIYDLENEEDVDTKRNYKLFTFHVEHRYNTLVPDINFRLHFKVKDYIDEQEEMEEDEACNTDRSWPPLSEAYVQKYLRLENYVLGKDIKTNKRKRIAPGVQREGDCIDPCNAKKKNTTEVEPSKLDDSSANLPTNLQNRSSNFQLEASTVNDDAIERLSTNLQSDNNSTQPETDTVDESAETLSSTLNDSVENFSTNLQNSNNSTQSAENIEKNLNFETPHENQNKSETSVLDKHDSGLGQSMLDEFDNTCNTQLNCTPETSQIENDSALGQSILEQSNTENVEDKNTTTLDDSAVETSIEEKRRANSESTVENLGELEAIEGGKRTPNSLETSPDEDTSLHTGKMANETEPVENNAKTEVGETVVANNDVLNMISEEGEDLKQLYIEELAKTTDSRSDPASCDDPIKRIPAGNLAISEENLNKPDLKSGKSLSSIDVIEEHDKNSTQINVHLPSPDDEGVCLSDLEEQDCRLLSPVIKTTNILPGVERKDITIIMDDELREALEMRDGIIKHFGCETFTVPVMSEPRKTNLIFNILRLPEKLVRRKILFKLGPDMDLYLKARSLRRTRGDTDVREARNYQFMKWFPLNNTDMTGVYMTPPKSPGHSSEFCGFSDSDDENKSCADFRGFTEEEQLMLNTKHLSRLSRDSGVGVDVNNLTPEKETLEVIFGEETNLAKENINSSETEKILEQLPDDIRNALSIEMLGSDELVKEEGGEKSNTPLQRNKSQKVDSLETELEDNLCSDEMTPINTESTETCPSDIAKEVENRSSPTQPQETDAVLTENPNATQTCPEQRLINSETFTASTECNEKPSEIETKTETHNETEALKSTEVGILCDETSSRQELDKSAVVIFNKELDIYNCADGSRDGMNDSDDDGILLDLDLQGSKTKIQQWHEHLQPILAKSRERHHFDIYKLGTEIINTVQGTPATTLSDSDEFTNFSAASFENIMMEKDKSYVSRYFLSTLLLANQSNIEISIENKSSDKPSAWHDIQLKLLSTKRHTVAIEDNIGMIDDSSRKRKIQNKKKQATEEAQRKPAANCQDQSEDDEDEPLNKMQCTVGGSLKIPLKRSSEFTATSYISEKKHKSVLPTKSQYKRLPNLVQSVQILQPTLFASSSSSSSADNTPRTIQQAQHKNLPFFNVNANAIRTLQPVEKVQKRCDDYDSGIFSVDDMSNS